MGGIRSAGQWCGVTLVLPWHLSIVGTVVRRTTPERCLEWLPGSASTGFYANYHVAHGAKQRGVAAQCPRANRPGERPFTHKYRAGSVRSPPIPARDGAAKLD
jgi:hypothetical protein